jgi:RNA polymerase sigma-70 factor (sigma-E family)
VIKMDEQDRAGQRIIVTSPRERRAADGTAGALGSPAANALERVYRREYPSLVALARLLIDRQVEAEEIVQEAFVRAYVAWERIEKQDDPLPYLRRSVVNLARDGLRRRGTVRRSPVLVADPMPGADAAVVLSETQQELTAALRQLPQRQRECVVLRYLLDCSTAETAAVLAISAGSVKTHLSRGLTALEATLEATR